LVGQHVGFRESEVFEGGLFAQAHDGLVHLRVGYAYVRNVAFQKTTLGSIRIYHVVKIHTLFTRASDFVEKTHQIILLQWHPEMT
jgi:hypothetical protein